MSSSRKLDEGALSNEEMRVLADASMDLLRFDWSAVAHAVEAMAVNFGGQVSGSKHVVRGGLKNRGHSLVKREAG